MLEQKQINNSISRVHYGWICATGGLSSQLVFGTATATLPLVLVAVEDSLNISHAQSGAIWSMFGLFFIIGALAWGMAADRIGLRKSLTIGCLLLSFGILGMGTINSAMMGMIFYSVIGFAAGAPITLSVMLAGAWFDGRRRGMAQSYISSTGFLWVAVLGIVVPVIMLAYGWRVVWYILGVLSLFLSGVVYALVRNNPREKGLALCGAQSKVAVKAIDVIPQIVMQDQVKRRVVLKMGITWHMCVVFILTIAMLTIPQFFVASYLMQEVGLSSVAAGFAYSIFSLMMMVGGFVWGFISDHIVRKYVVVTGIVLYAVSLLALITFGKETAVVYALMGAVGFAGGIPVVEFAMLPDYFNLKIIGTATGLVNGMSGVGSILGPLVAGYIATVSGSFIPAFYIAVIIAIVLATITLSLKRPPKSAA